nr:hypothetical protein [uncultured Pedobacter sp.]
MVQRSIWFILASSTSYFRALMSQPEKGQRVVQTFIKMKKFDIEVLKNT